MANNKKQAKSKAKPGSKRKSTDKKAYENCIKKNKSLTAKLRAAAKREKALKQELKKLKTKASGKKENKSSKKNKNSASSKTKKSSAKKSSAKKAVQKKKVTAKKTSTKAKPISTTESTKMPPARPQPRKVAATPKPRTSGTDNLKRIEGIGPAIERHLKSAGIDTFEKLGNETPGKIKALLLERGGTRYNVHDPANWPRQAKLAAAGKMDQLKALQAKLKAGK